MLNPDLILWGWLPVCFFLFKRQVPKWGVAKTTSFALVAGILLLPAMHFIKPPGVAHVDKHAFTVLGPYLAIRLLYPAFWRERSQLAGGGWWLFVVMALGLLGTSYTNGDPIDDVNAHLPALGLDELRVDLFQILIYFYLPWALGQRVYRSADELRTLVVAVVGGMMLVWLPILFELRFSPQLHNMVYGYHPFSFGQSVRSGGYRPVVLFNHGLTLAMYQSTTLVLLVALHKLKGRVWKLAASTILGIGLAVLVLSKSQGALVFFLIVGPAAFFLAPRRQMILAWCLAGVSLGYPLLRANDLIDDEKIIAFAKEKFGEERAQSLEFRLVNESALFDRAMERPLFGWGGADRSLISDPYTGRVLSVPDGEWILHLGMYGVLGYYARFGLYALALLGLTRNQKYLSPADVRLMAALGLVVSMYMIDQLPNSTSHRLPLIYAGALYTICRAKRLAVRSGIGQAPMPTAPVRAPHPLQSRS